MRKKIRLENNTFERIKKQYPDSNAIFNAAFEKMRLKASDRCVCGGKISKFYYKVPKQHSYRCRLCRRTVFPLSATPLKRLHMDMLDTLNMICMAYENKRILTPGEIVQLYNCSYTSANNQNKRIHQWIRLAIGASAYNFSINGHKRLGLVTCKKFIRKYKTINAAVEGLFECLPPLTEAMKNNPPPKN